MKWLQIKEKSAGRKRLIITWHLYKLLGKRIVKLISFFVAFITFIKDKSLRNFSRKYFNVLFEYTKLQALKPALINIFRHILSYAYSLIDKMEVFAGTFDNGDIEFDDKNIQQELFDLISKKKGVFFICNHIGNVDVMRSFLNSNAALRKPEVAIFLQKNHCAIFNEFTNSLLKETNKIKAYSIEDIDLSIAIELDDILSNGGIAFMAGDRTPASNKNNSAILLNKQIELPSGVFRIAKMVNAKIFMISCLKEKGKYKVYLEKVNKEESVQKLQEKLTKFMERMLLKAPFQFYHFYDYFLV
ncbi:MAG: hypothetical protein LUE64_06350 [Candidatus Gastranaerophilales bacterium]|nr:hypothetical protein [Candidatus Gastranaerophilales bacterium]